jgi:hypothetical protein
MSQSFTNAPPTTLSGNGGSINNSTLTIKVASVAGAPASGAFDILIGTEIIHIASQNGVDTFTVSASGRGAESTTAASHNDGDAVTYILTAAGLIAAITDRLAAYEPKFWDATVVAASDQDVASNTTVADDAELKFDLVAAATYYFELYLVYNSPVGTTTPDMKFAFAGPATLTGTYTNTLSLTTADAAQNPTTVTALTTTSTVGTAATARVVKIEGWVNSTGGGSGASGFRFQWAQNTSGANATRRLAGSLLRYRKVNP